MRIFKNRRRKARAVLIEAFETRVLLSASFDITGLTQLRNTAAYSNITGSGIGIAVLDTGVDAANPELAPNVVAFYNAVEDPVSGSSTAVSNAVDNDGHGTHVSGIAASSNPSIGVAYDAKLVDIKVIADANEQQLGGDPLLRGLEWVADNYTTYNIKVVSMSLGESGVNSNAVTAAQAQDAETLEIKTLEGLGITVVTASGNSYANNPTPGESFPADVSTIGVANTWADSGQASDFGVPFGEQGDQYYAIDYSATPDTLASTSQRSTLNNQLAAPGEDIYSDWNGTAGTSNGNDLLHNTLSGTSMATPFVSGTVALMQQASEYFGGHYLSPSTVLSILQSTATTIVDSNNPNNARYDTVTGATSNLPETGLSFKRVNVLAAIEAVQKLATGGTVITTPTPGPDTDNTTTTATPVDNIDGTTVAEFTGNIGNDGLVEVGPNDVDLYSLQIVSPGTVTFTLSLPSGGTAFAAELRLFDSSGNVVASTTGTAGAYPTLTTSAPLAVGTYYFGVSSAGNASYTINGTGAAGGKTEGDYQLQIQLFNPDPNGTIQGAVTVDLTNPNESNTDPNTGLVYTDVLEQGDLGSDPPPAGSSTRITVSSDVDMFSVVAPDTGTLSLTADSDIFSGNQTFLEIFDSTGKSLATASSENSGVLGENYLNYKVTSGDTYYVAITVPANSNFDPTDPYVGRTADATPTNEAYNLHIRFDNGDTDGTALAANNATVGQTVTADIGTDNGVMVGADGSKDVDWYTYTAPSDGLFTVTAASTTTGFTPDLSLWTYTSGGNSITKVADTATSSVYASAASAFAPSAATSASGQAELIYQVSAGDTIFVAVTGQGNGNFNWYAVASGTGGETGGYTLSTQIQPLSALATLSNNSIQNGTPTPIALGQTINANLGSDGPLVVGPDDIDMYKFVAPATETIDITTNTSQEGSADTVLRAFDANGNQLAANANINSSSTNSQVQISVQAGQTYYFGVSGAGADAMTYNPLTGAGTGAGSTGLYSITVSATAPGLSVATPAPVAAYNGGSIQFTVTLSQALTSSATVAYATSDGTAVAGTDYTAESGTLTFAAGVTEQTITVPVLVNSSAGAGNRTFTLTLSSPSGVTISTATATGTIQDEPITTLHFSAGKAATYTDSLHHVVQLILTGAGSGTAVFVNSAQDPTQITLSNTNAASVFAVDVKGPSTQIDDIIVNGSLAAIDGKSVALQGGITVSGSLERLTLNSANGGSNGASISIDQAAAAPMTVMLGAVSNESFSVVGAVKVLSVYDWLNSSGSTVALSAGSITMLQAAQDFAASLSTQAIGNAHIGGSLTGGAWNVAGNTANLSVAKSVASSWSGVFGGSIGAVHLGSDAGGITAGSIGTFQIAGSLSDSTITLTSSALALGELAVGKNVTNSDIVSAGDIGTVSVGTFSNSEIFAGVSSSVTGLPSATTDFSANRTISSVTVRGGGGKYAFSNSNIAAESIGKVVVGKVNKSNNGTPFGVAAVNLAAFTNRGVEKWTAAEPVSLLKADGDFVVLVI